METKICPVTDLKEIPAVVTNGAISHAPFISIRHANTKLSKAEFKAKVDDFIKNISAYALARSEYIASILLPDGKREGDHWVALNPTRADKQKSSFKINLKTGVWKEWATGEKGGGDLVSLVAYLNHGIKQLEAANILAGMVGIPHFEKIKDAAGLKHGSEYKAAKPIKKETKDLSDNLFIWMPTSECERLSLTDMASVQSRVGLKGKPDELYEYINNDEEVSFYVARFNAKGDRKKSFCVISYGTNSATGESGFYRKRPNGKLPLYNLKHLKENPEKPVFVHEGEKAANKAIPLFDAEYSVITSALGAGSEGQSDWSPLRGRDVIIWPDNDVSGKKYAENVAKLAVAAGANSVRIVQVPPEFPEKFDIADPWPEGFSFEDIKTCINNAALLNLEEIKKSDSDNIIVPMQCNNFKEGYGPVQFLFQNERNFVECCFQEKGLKVLPNGMIVYSDGRMVEKLLKEIRGHFAGFEKPFVKNLRPSFFEDIIWKIVEEQKLAHRQQIIDSIGIYKADPDNNLKKACDLLKGCNPRLIYFVLENIVRQIKQKMNGIEVTLPLVAIIVGNGYIGKTDFIRKVLLKPLKYLYTEPKLSDITETDKNYQLFSNNFALLCEEMSGANKAEVETLKHIITALCIQARIYHSQDRVQVPNNAVLIGTSNKRIWETIKDPKTMRRFIDLPVESIDFNSFHTIDTIALWQSVKYELNTQEKDAIFAEYNEIVTPLQEESRHRDDLEDWIEQYDLKYGADVASYKYLYKEFDLFLSKSCKKTNLSVRAFSKSLREIHRFEHKHTSKGDGICIDFEAFDKAKDSWENPNRPEKMDDDIPTAVLKTAFLEDDSDIPF